MTDYLNSSPDVFYLQAEPYYATGNPTLNDWDFQDAFGATPLKWVGLESPDFPHDAPPLSAYINGDATDWPVAGHGNQAFASREYGTLYIVAIKIRMGYGGPWVNTLAYVDDVTINDYFEDFEPPSSLGDCISDLINSNCSGLTGKDRAACNHEQQDICFDMFNQGRVRP